MDRETTKHYLADDPPSVVPLSIAPHFNALNQQEKLYAHYISIACFAGSRIVLRQVSPESEPIFDLIIELYHDCNGDWKALQKQANVPDDDMRHFLDYAAQFLGNLGNFKSFGDSKFVPRVHMRHFKALACASSKTLRLYEDAWFGLFANDTIQSMHLGYPDAGHVSTYYPESFSITKDEITAVSDFFESQKLLPENTRIRKTKDGNYEVLIASAEKDPSRSSRDLPETNYELTGSLAGKTATIVFGDHSTEMGKVANALREAQKYALNDTEAKMMGQYVKSFETGSLEAFKESQRLWCQDKDPTIESDIGFIETYRDPHGIRGEWEGFAAMVNKERTKAFGKLVESAPEQIPKLPWSKEFEKDNFLSPDFTSLEVMTFAGSGIPAGINIPNYDDIRQNLGFKNVSLGNVLSAAAPSETIPFIHPTDLPLYAKYRDPAFEVQVGLHELLGHGCGKLLQETSAGVFNFDKENPPVSPLTGEKVTGYYRPGATYSSVFGPLAASFEECRAEAVAMALVCDFDILSIFGFGSGGAPPDDMAGEAADILYVSYLSMARAGIASLEFWDPSSRKWGQAHMQARFSLLRTFLDAGGDFCSLHPVDKHGAPTTVPEAEDITVRIDRSKILSHGRPAVERYLQRIQIYKATADVEAAREMYEGVTGVDEFWAGLRPLVLRKKQPRKVFVQCNSVLEGEGDGPEGATPVLREYESTAEGMIRSWAEREYV